MSAMKNWDSTVAREHFGYNLFLVLFNTIFDSPEAVTTVSAICVIWVSESTDVKTTSCNISVFKKFIGPGAFIVYANLFNTICQIMEPSISAMADISHYWNHAARTKVLSTQLRLHFHHIFVRNHQSNSQEYKNVTFSSCDFLNIYYKDQFQQVRLCKYLTTHSCREVLL